MAALSILLAHAACSVDPGDDDSGDDDVIGVPRSPPAPAQLRATGSLRNIHLSWSASAGAAGYHVYRGPDGVEFTRLTDAPLTATSHDDPIDSPAGDGILYRYKVTAVGDAESEFSNIAQTVHGTRLVKQLTSFFETEPDKSPYVAEGAVRFDNSLIVSRETKLYVLDGAVIDIAVVRDKADFRVDGLIRSVPSGGAPAVFTAHRRLGGTLLNGEGLKFVFRGVPYNPLDDSGSLLEHVQIEHLTQGGSSNTMRGGMVVALSGIKLRNARLSGARSEAANRLSVETAWIILEDSYLERLTLSIASDVRGTPFKVARNVFRRASSIRMDTFRNDPAVGPGQIDSNDLDGVLGVELDGLRVPLGNNYWAGASGMPPLPASQVSDIADYSNPSPALTDPPPAGPAW